MEKKNDLGHRLMDSCAARITQIEAVVFSDFRLVGDFVGKCTGDIEAHGCGRIADVAVTNYHSQVRLLVVCWLNVHGISAVLQN